MIPTWTPRLNWILTLPQVIFPSYNLGYFSKYDFIVGFLLCGPRTYKQLDLGEMWHDTEPGQKSGFLSIGCGLWHLFYSPFRTKGIASSTWTLLLQTQSKYLPCLPPLMLCGWLKGTLVKCRNSQYLWKDSRATWIAKPHNIFTNQHLVLQPSAVHKRIWKTL